ncbi:MAG: AMP-binding protein [Geminicoccaceae bacterium]|nr:AMP-binding protein [Geminicoccaceae bacterium]MDW8342598.1 AMP-binding protein [Geminicoccaceae bacterium]
MSAPPPASAITRRQALSGWVLRVGAGALLLLVLVVGGCLAMGAPVAALVLGVLCAFSSLLVLALPFLSGPALQRVFRAAFRLLFRLEVRGAERFAAAGSRRILIANHVSFLDGPLLLAALPEIPVFAVWHDWLARWWLAPFREPLHLVAVDPTKPMEARRMADLVASGTPLAIFPEGRITVTGGLMKIYAGPAWIADRAKATIVPARIEGAELSLFSRLTKGQVRRRLFPRLVVTLLEPRRLELPEELKGRPRRRRAATVLHDFLVEALFRTADREGTLFEAALDARARHGAGSEFARDVRGTRLTFGRLVTAALLLGRRLARESERGEVVGLFLPNACATVATFMALQAIGRVPALLNYAAGIANLCAAVDIARIRLVLASRGFVEQARLERELAALAACTRVLFLEDLRAELTRAARLRALFDSRAARRFHRRFAVAPEDTAVVLFTSGSEGRPKAVALSHRALLANAAQAAVLFDFGRHDRTFAALPLFHAFGLLAGLVLPLRVGARVFLYPSPLHYRTVAELVYGTDSTILFGTDTFLRGYARVADPLDFRSLRYLFAGAEKLQEETRRLWQDRFGVRVLEGYGATETGPVLAVNTPAHSRPGSVGRFLPGIEWRLEPVTGIPEGGRLFVRGPNLMRGYLDPERPGALLPPPGGWYDTGDVVAVDEEGFVRILGRAKRFAKVGGEMVSLAAAEELFARALPDAQHAVLATADARKGERLVLATTARGLDRAALVRIVREAGESELLIPAEVVEFDELPRLATGKPDYPAIARLLEERRGEAPAVA